MATHRSHHRGKRQGGIASYASNVACRLKVSDRAAVAVSIEDTAPTEGTTEGAHCLSVPAPDLVARVPLQLPAPDARGRSQHLSLNLHRDGDPAPRANQGDGRLGNGYSHWCELTRKA